VDSLLLNARCSESLPLPESPMVTQIPVWVCVTMMFVRPANLPWAGGP
jgi:hypothetical protein